MKPKKGFNGYFNKFKLKDVLSSWKESSKQYSALMHDEMKKPKEERKKDLIALILTLIIVSILIFIIWKVPFLHNIIFP